MREEAILLGPDRSLVGIHTPAVSGCATRRPRLAMVLLNADLIHHVGPSRLYVKLARVLAGRGVATLRVDFSGIGDNTPHPNQRPADELGMREPREILDELSRRGHDSFLRRRGCARAEDAPVP